MPTPPELYLSREWSERPVSVGVLHLIQTSVKEVMASQRAAERREWAKEAKACAFITLGLAASAVVWMVL